MKRNALITCLICSAWMMSACSSTPFNAENKEFAAFLELNFKYTLPESGKNVYMLIPSCQCKNCILLRTEKLPQDILEKIHIVSSIDTVYFPGFKQYLFDTENKLIKLSFIHYANQIVLTEGSKIAGIVRLRDFEKQLDSLSDWVRK